MPQFHTVTPHLHLFEDTCNVYVLRHEDRALLIDCGSGEVGKRINEIGVSHIDWVLFTHHHRDQCFGAGHLVSGGARLAAPRFELAHFENAEQYWQQKRIYDNYNDRNTFFTIGRDLPVDTVLDDYETFAWGPYTLTILPAPGHTSGSIALVGTIDGQHVAFTGDLMHDGGKLYQLHAMEYEYGDLVGVNFTAQSLCSLGRQNLDMALPSHGPVIADPATCMSDLDRRLHEVVEVQFHRAGLTENGLFAHEIRMEEISPHLLWGTAETCSNFYVIRADNGKALIVDYPHAALSLFMVALHSAEPYASLRFVEHHLDELRDDWGVTSFDVVIPTHIHDDHVCGIPYLQRHHNIECWALDDVAKVLAAPAQWNTPCLLETPIRIDRKLSDGESFQWEGFDFQIVHYPGQTEFHSAVLAQVDGRRVLFSGDSSYPVKLQRPDDDSGGWVVNGIMRNSVTLKMHRKCADEFERLQPEFLCPGHGPCWDVPANAAAEHRAFIERKEVLWRDLVPAPADLGIDLFWARLRPYQSRLRPGGTGEFTLELRNPYDSRVTFTAQLECAEVAIETQAESITLDPGIKGILSCRLRVADDAPADTGCRRVITVLIDADAKPHGPVCEALLVIDPDAPATAQRQNS